MLILSSWAELTVIKIAALEESRISWLSLGGVVYTSKLSDKTENKFISRVS